MEKTVSAARASSDFLGILEQVGRGDQIVITRRGRRRAVLLDYEQLKTIQAVARLARDPDVQASIARSDEDVRVGRTYRLRGKTTLRRLRALSRKAAKSVG